ncbi:MAG: hypothetical protein ACREHD_34295, partial [Pirellulales bacterium]
DRFIATVRLLSRFSREPVSEDKATAIERSYLLRDAIDRNFDNVRALADGVLFEFRSSRERDLALRNRIRALQPQLRALFVLHISMWNYRLPLPGFDLPEPIRSAHREFDEDVARTLEAIADRLEGKPAEPTGAVADSLRRLERTVERYVSSEPAETIRARLQIFLARSHRVGTFICSVLDDIHPWERAFTSQ